MTTPEQGSLGTTALALPPLPLPIERLCQVGPLLHAMDARERILVSHADGLQRQLTAALARIKELEAVCAGHYANTVEALRQANEADARIAANDDALSWIGELLAVMHADGGHYLAKHGMEKAIGDAMDKYHAMHQRIDKLEKQLGEAHCDASHYASRVAWLEAEAGRRTREVEATYHVQTRLNARIKELVEALESSTEIMARMYGPQAESLPPIIRNRKALDAARTNRGIVKDE